MTYKVTLFGNVCPNTEKQHGGMFLSILKNQLESKGVEVDICCKRGKGVLSYGEYYKDVIEYLKRTDSDIMQIEQFPHSAIIPSIFNNKYNGSGSHKLLTRFHGFTDSSFGDFSFINKNIQKQCIGASDGIISVSPAVGENIYKKYGVGSYINPVIGIDTDKFRPMDIDECKEICGLDKNKKYMIYVGRNSRGKNTNGIITSALIAKKCYGIETIIVGDYINSKYVKNIGYVKNENLPYYYNSAEFMCYPSFNEGFGIAIAECLACGVPVVVRYDCGFLSWFGDRKFFDNKLERLLSNHIEHNFIYSTSFEYVWVSKECSNSSHDYGEMRFKKIIDEILKNKNDDNIFHSSSNINAYMKKMFGVDKVINDLVKIHKLTMGEDYEGEKVNAHEFS